MSWKRSGVTVLGPCTSQRAPWPVPDRGRSPSRKEAKTPSGITGLAHLSRQEGDVKCRRSFCYTQACPQACPRHACLCPSCASAGTPFCPPPSSKPTLPQEASVGLPDPPPAWGKRGEGFVVLSLCLGCPSLPGSSVLRWGTPGLERGRRWPLGLGGGPEQLQPQAPSEGEAANEVVVLVVRCLQKP